MNRSGIKDLKLTDQQSVDSKLLNEEQREKQVDIDND